MSSSSAASCYMSWDIISQILFYLPVKTILRIRSVSKLWCNLIDDPDFTKMYHYHSIKSNNSKLIIEYHRRMLSVDLSMLEDRNIDDGIPLHKKRLNSAYVVVVASCNGLFCLYNSTNNTIIFWNPSTMTHQNIHKIPKYSKGSIEPLYITGFGYDAINDDYKLVLMTEIRRPDDNHNSLHYYVVHIYSLKSDSWRKIHQVIPYKIIDVMERGAFVKSALHWMVKSVEKSINIIAFDIGTEEYREVATPNCKMPNLYPRIDVLGGNLCFFWSYTASNKFYVDLWVMKEYGVKSSWMKLLSVCYSSLDQCMQNPIRPLGYSKCGKKVLIVKGNNAIFWYDLGKNVKSNLTFQPKPSSFKPYVCLDSLVRLRDSINTNNTTTGKRKRKRKRTVIKIKTA